MTTTCELRWCKSRQPAAVRVLENIGDGAFAANICQPCAGALGLGTDGDLPDAQTVQRVIEALYATPEQKVAIGNATEAEQMAMRICAERNGGACHCRKVWGYPKDAYRACEALLAKVKAGIKTVKAKGGDDGRRAA